MVLFSFYPEKAALIIKTSRLKAVVAAEFHIGYEKTLADKRINIPSQTPKILSSLTQVIDEVKPDRLILLGDVKHDVSFITDAEWREVPDFFNTLREKVGRIDVIPGNHDGNLKALVYPGVRFHSNRGMIVKAGEKHIGLLHGHTWPSPRLFAADMLVMGHTHPTIEFRDTFGYRIVERVWVKARIRRRALAEAFLGVKRVKPGVDALRAFEEKYGVPLRSREVLIMPAFNPLLGGSSVNKRMERPFLGPLLQSGAANLEKAEVFLLDSTYLGQLEDLRQFSEIRRDAS